jgi:integrase
MADRLTDRGIAALKPSTNSVYHFDTEVSGLAVRVYPSGIKSFIFDWRHHGKQRRITIGKHPAWTIGKARIHASRLRLKADTGEVVAVQRGMRVADLVEAWKATVRLTRRPNTVLSYLRLLDTHIVPAFGKDDPRAITRNRIEAWHGSIAQAAVPEANRALAVLSTFLSWLEHDHRIERNVAKGVKRRPENQRHIFLDESEIARAHATLEADSNRAAALALRLALATGARIGEILTLTEGQLNIGRRLWIKPHHLTKQKKTHILPLQPEALAIAQALLVIGLPNYTQVKLLWKQVRVAIGRPEVTIHDLRHSRASALARNGASLPMIGQVLGHASASTTARYAHLVDGDLRALVERS